MQALQLGSCDCLRKLVPVTEATLPDASLLTLVRGPFPWFKALRRKDCLWQETTSINAVQLLHKYKYHDIAMLYLLFHVFPAKTCELFVHEEHPAPAVRCLTQAEDQTLTHTHTHTFASADTSLNHSNHQCLWTLNTGSCTQEPMPSTN